MNSKQEQLEQTVIEYFRGRQDTTVAYDSVGVYQVDLRSESARQHFGSDQGQLRLIFDSDLRSINLDSELMTTSHPFLEVIRNDLDSDERHNPRLCEAHIALQLLAPSGQLTVPAIDFSERVYRTSQIQIQQNFLPTFVLTYRIIYETDERSENVVRLCYDARTGELQPALLQQLPELFVSDGGPQDVGLASTIELSKILDSGRNELESRVQTDLHEVSRQIDERLAKDRASLQAYYDAEIRTIEVREKEIRRESPEGRRQLQERFEKNIQDIEHKYAFQIRIQLLSVLKLWWPLVYYTLSITNQRRAYTLQEICYNAQTGQTNFQVCPVCGNHSQFDVCLIGAHVTCSHCNSALLDCSVCQDSMCATHGSACGHCTLPVCVDDQQACSYGYHVPEVSFCPSCLAESFEGKTLCKDCLQYCASCRRPFAHEHVDVCRTGGEHICHVVDADPCGQTCHQCGELTCTKHGRPTFEQTWVCSDHGALSTCCDQRYAHRRLQICCIDDQERLCPTHVFSCAHCAATVCEPHSSALRWRPEQRVCDQHRVTCKDCAPELSYIAADLADCVICSQSICSDHVQRCGTCQQPVCAKDRRMSAKGETLCVAHAGVCASCPHERALHRKTELATCVKCRATTCTEHHFRCATCAKTTLCLTHRAELPTCANCGRASCESSTCSPRAHSCAECGTHYCAHCVSAANGKSCPLCKKLAAKAFDVADQAMIDYLQKLRREIIDDAAIALDAVLGVDPNITFKVERNRTYEVLIVRARASFFQKLRTFDFALSKRQLRIVIQSNGQIENVRVENTAD